MAGCHTIILELATNLVSYHASLCCSFSEYDAINLLLECDNSWNVFKASNLEADGPSERAIAQYAKINRLRFDQVPVEDSPYLPIESDWESYIATRPKKFRYKLRQRQQLLDSDTNGKLTKSVYSIPEHARPLFDDLLVVESQSWKADYGLELVRGRGEGQYYSKLIPYLASIGALFAIVLYIEKRPIAYSLCCSWNGWFGHLKTSFDKQFSHLSPGAIVIDLSIRSAFESGAKEFDFLGDKDNHKLHWTDRSRPHNDVLVYSRHFRALALGNVRALKRRVIRKARTPTIKPQ